MGFTVDAKYCDIAVTGVVVVARANGGGVGSGDENGVMKIVLECDFRGEKGTNLDQSSAPAPAAAQPCR